MAENNSNLQQSVYEANRLPALQMKTVAEMEGIFHLGRRPRMFDERVPKLSELLGGAPLPPVPAQVDYTLGMPAYLGAMRNDTLGDCTCAAYYHALQVWSFNAAKKLDTEPDIDVVDLYQQACGYNPQQPGEGPGGHEQKVLTYLLNTGAPCGPNGTRRHKIEGFVEIPVNDINAIKATINTCGVAYIGFNVPRYIMPVGQAPVGVWDVNLLGNNSIIGGHAVVLAGYNDVGVRVISWGSYYTMTWAFFQKFVEEAYAIVDAEWVRPTGKSPLGLTMTQIEESMRLLKQH